MRILDRRFGAEQVMPGSESPIVIYESSPFLSCGSLGFDISSCNVVVGLTLYEPFDTLRVGRDEVGIVLASRILSRSKIGFGW
jgi:hypothetical protein